MFHFSSPFRRTFKSSLCSCASCFSLFFLLVAILAPLFFAYFSQGFWINVEVKNLKPQVALTKDLQLFLTDASTGQAYSFSTIKDRYEASDNSLGIPIIKLFTQDTNYDGQSDVFNLEVGIPKGAVLSGNGIKQIELYLGVSYGFSQNDLEVTMQGLLPISISFSGPIESADVIGEIELVQKESFVVGKTYSEYNFSILKSASSDVTSLIQEYYKRDYYTRASYVEFVQRGVSGDTDGFAEFRIKLRVPPKSAVRLVPALNDEILFAWLQYFYILIPLWVLLSSFMDHVYTHQIIEARVLHDFSQGSLKAKSVFKGGNRRIKYD